MLASSRNMSKSDKLAAERILAQGMLDGTHLVPTKTCRKCHQPALVKDGALQSGMRGCSGTAVVPEITICLSQPCQHVAVRRPAGLADMGWQYGTTIVELVDGPSYVKKMLPLVLTSSQHIRLREFLIQTAPR